MTAVTAPPPLFRTAWFRAGLALGGAGWLALVWNALCTVPGVPWNPARLSAAFALSRGLPFYATRDSGAHLGWFYGPVTPVWYLPVTLVDNPTLALVLAGVLNLATMLAPFALVLAASGVARGWALAAATLAAGVLLAGDHTHWAAYYFIHVDLVCLALGAAGCVALHRTTVTGDVRWLHAAALGAVLAFWAKVLALPLFLALPWWLWREGRARLVRPLLFWFLVYGGAVSAVFFAWFGAEEILFNVWLIHARNPYYAWAQGDRLPGALLEHLGKALAFATVWLVLAVWAWGDARLDRETPRLPDRAASLVRLLCWVALAMLPLGALAPLKSGGTLGSLHTVSWLFMAAMVWFWQRWTRPARGWAGVTAVAVFALAMMASAWRAHADTREFPGEWKLYRGLEADLAQARANPGKIYFPWNPMLTIISERRVYPLDDALYCLWLAGLEPPPEKVRAAVPPDALRIYHEPPQSKFVERYFQPPPAARKEGAP
jgi:hypothetical protein